MMNVKTLIQRSANEKMKLLEEVDQSSTGRRMAFSESGFFKLCKKNVTLHVDENSLNFYNNLARKGRYFWKI